MSVLFNAVTYFAQQVDISPLPHASADSTTIKSALTVTFVIVGALALLMITLSGFRYIIAQDDAQKVAQAKRGIIYSAVGLVVAASGQLIVTYVIGHV
jgi:uncharacterized membrane protein YidH (DUF202 family)